MISQNNQSSQFAQSKTIQSMFLFLQQQPFLSSIFFLWPSQSAHMSLKKMNCSFVCSIVYFYIFTYNKTHFLNIYIHWLHFHFYCWCNA